MSSWKIVSLYNFVAQQQRNLHTKRYKRENVTHSVHFNADIVMTSTSMETHNIV